MTQVWVIYEVPITGRGNFCSDSSVGNLCSANERWGKFTQCPWPVWVIYAMPVASRGNLCSAICFKVVTVARFFVRSSPHMTFSAGWKTMSESSCRIITLYAPRVLNELIASFQKLTSLQSSPLKHVSIACAVLDKCQAEIYSVKTPLYPSLAHRSSCMQRHCCCVLCVCACAN